MQTYPDWKIVELIEAYMQGSDNADLKGYREQTRQRDFANKQGFLWSLKLVSSLGQYKNKRILDVGCGFGWHCFALSLLNRGSKVYGIDILPSMIDGMKECIESMRKKKQVADFDLTAICGDICNFDFEPHFFDAIFSNEAIEHVHDMEKMIERCKMLLKPDGNLILINDANMLNLKMREQALNVWQQRETSWEWANYLRKIRPIEHRDARPFALMREEIVKAAGPNLEPVAVQAVVGATAGLLKSEIEQIAKSYRPGTTLRHVPKYDWCRNPLTGEYAERLFDPFALGKKLRSAGFKTQVRHMYRRFPLNLVNGMQFRPLNHLLFKYVRPVFLIYAYRVSGP
jgi:2-polyprenyl-3-methyl-5-hydroxy-6-metoxy-1,4-benzoquinol methylase